jgi:processive 1,2-diacylglycerol beta-glucosyltransferase
MRGFQNIFRRQIVTSARLCGRADWDMESRRVKKILLFTAGFGEDHNTAARNVRDGLEFLAEDEAQVEIVDLFDVCYGRFNDFMRKAYLTAIHETPKLWQGFYHFLDNSNVVESNLTALARMRTAMEDLLRQVQPDAVVSTYPVYGHLIDEIHRDGRPRNFSHITLVTDSISVNSLWYRCASDIFIVANEETAEVLRQAHVPEAKIRVLGFPVQLEFVSPEARKPLPDLARGGRPRILYLINSGKKKAPRVLEQMLEHREWDLTVVTGRDLKLQRLAAEIVANADAGGRVRVLGWTHQMPQLMLSHHIVVSKAGGATVQEAIAAACPLIVNKVVPGQEEGNYELLRRAQAGMLAEKPKEIAGCLERAFADNAQLWRLWKKNIRALSRPDSSLQIARFILDEAIPANVPIRNGLSSFLPAPEIGRARPARKDKQLLMCDFHTHTTYSDGKLTVGELVDFYGQRGFDCLSITDHLCDPRKLLGKMVNWTGLVIPPEQIGEYFEAIEKEKKRAWKKYDLLLMTGIEFNKDGLTEKTSAHLLGIDLKEPISPSLGIKETIGEIHRQGGLAVASHPHEMKSIWGRNTLYFWENIEEYSPLLDAWEVANRDDIFNPVGLKRLPFLANSDFHKPKHIHSWKTVLFCEKDSEAIKQCVRENRDVALTLYRDHRFGFAQGRDVAAQVVDFSPLPAIVSQAG